MGLSVVQEFSYIFAMAGIFALLGSGAVWWSAFRQRQLQPAAGRLERETRENWAGMALVAAFGLSLVAAILAIFAWLF